NKVAITSRILNNDTSGPELETNLALLRNEITKENGFLRGLRFEDVNKLTPELVDEEILAGLVNHLDLLTEHYKRVYLKADAEKEDAIYAMTQTEDMHEAYKKLFNNYKNDQLEVCATNRDDAE